MGTVLLNLWFNETLAGTLGKTFIHSLWIGLIAAVFAGLIVSRTAKSSARLRYNLLGAVLLLFMGAVSIVFYFELRQPVFTSSVNTRAFTVFTGDAVQTNEGAGILSLIFTYLNKYTGLIFQIWAVFFLFRTGRLL